MENEGDTRDFEIVIRFYLEAESHDEAYEKAYEAIYGQEGYGLSMRIIQLEPRVSVQYNA